MQSRVLEFLGSIVVRVAELDLTRWADRPNQLVADWPDWAQKSLSAAGFGLQTLEE